MTRINVVDPSELHNKHLMGELHEITRVYGLVRKAQDRKINKYNFKEKIKQPFGMFLPFLFSKIVCRQMKTWMP